MIFSACTFFCYYVGTLMLLLTFIVLRLLKLVPCAQWIISEFVNRISTIQMPREDYWDSLFTWSMFSSKRSSMLLELQKTASRGKIAPDPQLISVDGKSRYRLLELCRGNRPLVVNFGSWTCPVFRNRVNDFLSIVQEFSDVADFLAIYIEEAHPTNGWKLENNITIPQHQTQEERCSAAKLMLDSVKFNCPVVVDTMANDANKAYAGMPIRLYIIQRNQIQYAGGMGPTFYNLKEVRQWLQNIRIHSKTTRHRA